MKIKNILISVCLVSLGYLAGNFSANHRWFTAYFSEAMTSGEQNSVMYSIIYMEKYLEGDVNGAHDWIKSHSLSDPEWNLAENDDFFNDAVLLTLDLSSNDILDNIEELRLKQLGEIKQKQNKIRELTKTSADEQNL